MVDSIARQPPEGMTPTKQPKLFGGRLFEFKSLRTAD